MVGSLCCLCQFVLVKAALLPLQEGLPKTGSERGAWLRQSASALI